MKETEGVPGVSCRGSPLSSGNREGGMLQGEPASLIPSQPPLTWRGAGGQGLGRAAVLEAGGRGEGSGRDWSWAEGSGLEQGPKELHMCQSAVQPFSAPGLPAPLGTARGCIHRAGEPAMGNEGIEQVVKGE